MVAATSTKRRRINEVENQEIPTTTTTSSRAGGGTSSMVIKKNSPVIVFAHGAGAPSSSEWMIRWRNLLLKALNPVDIVTFDYPYISGRRKAPPKAEKLVEYHVDVVKKTVAKYPGHPLILAGKSMGSRVSCMVAAEEDIGATAVVCLGYPLKGTNGAPRDETLLQLTVPTMFVQGSKDQFCPLDMLEMVRRKMQAVNALHVLEAGDHSFQIGKKHLESTGYTREQAEDEAAQAIATFVSRVLAGCNVGGGGEETRNGNGGSGFGNDKEPSGGPMNCEVNPSANFSQMTTAGRDKLQLMPEGNSGAGCHASQVLSEIQKVQMGSQVTPVSSYRSGKIGSPMKRNGRNVRVRSEANPSVKGTEAKPASITLQKRHNREKGTNNKPSTNPPKRIRRSARLAGFRRSSNNDSSVIVID